MSENTSTEVSNIALLLFCTQAVLSILMGMDFLLFHVSTALLYLTKKRGCVDLINVKKLRLLTLLKTVLFSVSADYSQW